MFTRHVDHLLARYCDGELSATERRRVDAHLASCARCRAALEEIEFSAGVMRQITTVAAPPSVWHAIDAALPEPQRSSRAPVTLRWAPACALILAIGVSAYWWTRGSADGVWEVTRADGASRRMARGEWVETDHGSRARIVVGDIGTVDVAAGTRVRLGEVRDSEYRLSLQRGTISAEIVAPPRFFIVDTPASTVVDLGCAYTITVGEDGAGELRMTSGWAALEFKGRESLVPAGAICRTRPGAGPGTPYFEDASAALKEAIEDFDRGSRPGDALGAILRESRIRDTLTLWHLLSRVEADDRARVYDRIAGFEAPPAGVSRDRVLALDADALRQWREELAWKW
jgi:predicted anti-sigma-YlaC factor YlaD